MRSELGTLRIRETRTDEAMYGLVGKIIATPDQRDALIEILLAGTEDMPGCLSYVRREGREGPRRAVGDRSLREGSGDLHRRFAITVKETGEKTEYRGHSLSVLEKTPRGSWSLIRDANTVLPLDDQQR